MWRHSLHHVWVKHPLHFIFGKEIGVAVAVGIVGGGEDEEPLEYLKVTDVVEEGHSWGSPLHKRIKLSLFTEATIIANISLDDDHCRCNGTAQGWCGDTRSWRSLNGSKPDVEECHGAWDVLAAL